MRLICWAELIVCTSRSLQVASSIDSRPWVLTYLVISLGNRSLWSPYLSSWTSSDIITKSECDGMRIFCQILCSWLICSARRSQQFMIIFKPFANLGNPHIREPINKDIFTFVHASGSRFKNEDFGFQVRDLQAGCRILSYIVVRQ